MPGLQNGREWESGEVSGVFFGCAIATLNLSLRSLSLRNVSLAFSFVLAFNFEEIKDYMSVCDLHNSLQSDMCMCMYEFGRNYIS